MGIRSRCLSVIIPHYHDIKKIIMKCCHSQIKSAEKKNKHDVMQHGDIEILIKSNWTLKLDRIERGNIYWWFQN